MIEFSHQTTGMQVSYIELTNGTQSQLNLTATTS